ncbi:class I SAM-dependent methyltransferase [Halorussus sp. JP-T4]|nr:class I SAM-dependent methyltransferase [Halorussus sp. JP-T4]
MGAVYKSGVLSVVATDAAPTMVATVKAKFPSIIGAVADAEQLPFPDDMFDAVMCRIAAHHSLQRHL